MNATKVSVLFNKTFRPRGKYSFLNKLAPNSTILDVGCGNNSPFIIKSNFPNLNYTGIDVGNWNQTKPLLADNYIITKAETFATEIAKFSNHFDAVISSHNIEHCNDREKTIEAMLGAIKPGGRIYISFPCEKSINFPRRQGVLNYFDDDTHKYSPPGFKNFREILRLNNFQIQFAVEQYQPAFLWFFGLMMEPISRAQRRVREGTREYFGFESIVWAKKLT